MGLQMSAEGFRGPLDAERHRPSTVACALMNESNRGLEQLEHNRPSIESAH